jgi:hypothetical protein
MDACMQALNALFNSGISGSAAKKMLQDLGAMQTQQHYDPYNAQTQWGCIDLSPDANGGLNTLCGGNNTKEGSSDQADLFQQTPSSDSGKERVPRVYGVKSIPGSKKGRENIPKPQVNVSS